MNTLYGACVCWFCLSVFFQLCCATGVLPDGSYNKNTKIQYCCRNDGSTERPVQLPSSAPFYLYKLGDACQEVYSPNLYCSV